jgi:hypothetical protein
MIGLRKFKIGRIAGKSCYTLQRWWNNRRGENTKLVE